MKRLIIGLIALIALIAIYFAVQKEDNGIPIEEVNFAVENIDKVDRIVLQDRSGTKLELLKERSDLWWVNGEYPAFTPFVDLFMTKTLSRIQLKGPVPKAAKDNVIRNMVGNAIKVEIYEGGAMVKSYYVGEHTPDMKGTYLHIEGSETPYIGYIPGFDGYITPKYNLNAKEWFNRSIFDYSVDSIVSINLEYKNNPEYSFKLSKDGDSYAIEPSLNLSTQAAKSYFALYNFKNFEGYADYLDQATKDSIKRSEPVLLITVKDIAGISKELKIYKKGSDSEGLKDSKGNLLAYDPERYFATFTGFDKLVTVQEYTFGKLFAKHSEFQN